MAYMRPYYRFCRYLCQVSMVLYERTRVFGVSNVPEEGGVLLVSNHQSFLDPVLTTMALPREGNYMARDTLFANPAFKRLCESLNAFPVKRGAADVNAIKESIRRLREGRLVVVFPEGTRTLDGRIGPMLAGVAAIAQKTGVPVVPTLIDGAFQSWPRHSPLPKPGNIIIEYDRPIGPAEYTGLSAEALIGRIRERIIAMQRRWHSRVPQRRLQWYGQQPDEVRHENISSEP